MSRSWVWVLGLLAVSCVAADHFQKSTVDQDFLSMQKKVYNLLYHISQPSKVNPTLYNEGRSWSVEDNMDSYNSPAVVKEFLEMYKNGMLPRGELFSLYYPKMLKEMVALFKLFYAANDFNVFYSTALWARVYLNEGQFCFALYNAVLRRPDTKHLLLPQPYEMYPYDFFNSDVLEKANHAKVLGKLEAQKVGGLESYILPANYSGWYLNREYDMENKLNYFVEDVGLNSYYFFFRLDHPFWLPSDEYNLASVRGEEYLYGHKQLMNRYYLERLSNDLPKVGEFDWQRPFPMGYYPTMTYHNGLPFPQRPSWSPLPNYKLKYVKKLQELEMRLSSAVDSGYMLGANGTFHNVRNEEGGNMLGNALEGNKDSCNSDFYGSVDALARKVLGYNLEPVNNYQVVPSALESFTSCMRDPAFYRLYQRVVNYYNRFKMLQKPYTREEVVFPSLKLESVNVDKLFTYFDQFDATVSNGLLVESQEEAESTLVKVRQYRLNHKPFNMYLILNAEQPMKAVVRFFLGPKYDAHHKLRDLPESFKNFYELDQWMVELSAGQNKLVRNSKDVFFLSPDPEPSEVFYKKLLRSLDTSEPFVYETRLSGFPERLLLPKGKKEGMPLQLFVHVSPIFSEVSYNSRTFGDYKMDGRSFGFPLDKLSSKFVLSGPNMMLKDVLVYHKDDSEMNMPY